MPLQRDDTLPLVGSGIHDIDPVRSGYHHLMGAFHIAQQVRGHALRVAEIEDRQFEHGFVLGLQHLVQVVHDAQRLVVFGAFLDKRPVLPLDVRRVQTAYHESDVMRARRHRGVHQIDQRTRDVPAHPVHVDDVVVGDHDVAVLRDIRHGAVDAVREHGSQRGELAAGSRHELDTLGVQLVEQRPEVIGDVAVAVQQRAIHVRHDQADVARLVADGGPIVRGHGVVPLSRVRDVFCFSRPAVYLFSRLVATIWSAMAFDSASFGPGAGAMNA